LEQGDEGEPGRRRGRLSTGGEEVGELVVAVERSEFVGDAETEGSLGEGGMSHTLSFFGDGEVRPGME
jgi:hypothetical protein